MSYIINKAILLFLLAISWFVLAWGGWFTGGTGGSLE